MIKDTLAYDVSLSEERDGSKFPIWRKLQSILPQRRHVLPFVLPVVLLVLWQVTTQYHWIAPQILPKPGAVVHAVIEQSQTRLGSDLAISTQRAFLGFLIGGGIGFVFGLINGLFRLGEEILDTTMHMFRTVPHLALIPLIIIWFGIGETTKIVLVALGVFFPMYLNTFRGIREVDPGLIEAGRVYGLRGIQLFTKIILPGALPSILLGVRFSLGIMWLTLIVAETIGTTSGIGYLATSAREYMQTDVVVLVILLYALLGKGADVAARLLESYFLPWHHAFAKTARR